jgi:hypothetical protein
VDGAGRRETTQRREFGREGEVLSGSGGVGERGEEMRPPCGGRVSTRFPRTRHASGCSGSRSIQPPGK